MQRYTSQKKQADKCHGDSHLRFAGILDQSVDERAQTEIALKVFGGLETSGQLEARNLIFLPPSLPVSPCRLSP